MSVIKALVRWKQEDQEFGLRSTTEFNTSPVDQTTYLRTVTVIKKNSTKRMDQAADGAEREEEAFRFWAWASAA